KPCCCKAHQLGKTSQESTLFRMLGSKKLSLNQRTISGLLSMAGSPAGRSTTAKKSSITSAEKLGLSWRYICPPTTKDAIKPCFLASSLNSQGTALLFQTL